MMHLETPRTRALADVYRVSTLLPFQILGIKGKGKTDTLLGGGASTRYLVDALLTLTTHRGKDKPGGQEL